MSLPYRKSPAFNAANLARGLAKDYLVKEATKHGIHALKTSLTEGNLDSYKDLFESAGNRAQENPFVGVKLNLRDFEARKILEQVMDDFTSQGPKFSPILS